MAFHVHVVCHFRLLKIKAKLWITTGSVRFLDLTPSQSGTKTRVNGSNSGLHTAKKSRSGARGNRFWECGSNKKGSLLSMHVVAQLPAPVFSDTYVDLITGMSDFWTTESRNQTVPPVISARIVLGLKLSLTRDNRGGQKSRPVTRLEIHVRCRLNYRTFDPDILSRRARYFVADRVGWRRRGGNHLLRNKRWDHDYLDS